MKKIRFSILLVLFLCFESFYALKFYLKEGNEKCFLDEIPDQTVFFKNFLKKNHKNNKGCAWKLRIY